MAAKYLRKKCWKILAAAWVAKETKKTLLEHNAQVCTSYVQQLHDDDDDDDEGK